jgi:hypothetical protein
VPDPLLGFVHTVLKVGRHDLRVVRAHPASVSPHLRLLVELTSDVPEDWTPFAGREWQTAA